MKQSWRNLSYASLLILASEGMLGLTSFQTGQVFGVSIFVIVRRDAESREVVIVLIFTNSFPFHDGQRRSLPCVRMSCNVSFTSLSQFLRRFHTNPVTTQITAATKVHDTATTVIWDAEFSGAPSLTNTKVWVVATNNKWKNNNLFWVCSLKSQAEEENHL